MLQSRKMSAWSKGSLKTTGKVRALHFRDYIHRAKKACVDTDRERREELRECAFCYYVSRAMAGQAFTEFVCAACEKSFSHPNTRVPLLCDECADTHGACVRCGGSRVWTVEEALGEGWDGL